MGLSKIERHAKSVTLVKSHDENSRGEVPQDWEITDHTGTKHKFRTRAGHGDEPSGRGLHKKFHVDGQPATAREIIGEAISTGEGPVEDKDTRKISRGNTAGFPFAWRK